LGVKRQKSVPGSRGSTRASAVVPVDVDRVGARPALETTGVARVLDLEDVPAHPLGALAEEPLDLVALDRRPPVVAVPIAEGQPL
jgi:hypothetical protein